MQLGYPVRREALTGVLDALLGDARYAVLVAEHPGDGVVAMIALSSRPVLRLHGWLGTIEEQVVKAMEDYGVHIVAALERHLPILATISSVAPMVGSVDATFLERTMVVFMDLVSGYVLLEEVADDRVPPAPEPVREEHPGQPVA